MITVQYAVWDETVPPPAADSKKIGKLYDRFRWEDVTRLGPHAPLGLPAGLEFKAGAVTYRAEAQERDRTLRLTVTPLEPTHQRIVFILVAPVGQTESRASPTRGRFAGCEVRFRNANWPREYFVNIAEPYAIGRPGRPASVLIRPSPAQRASRPRSPARPTRALEGQGALAQAPGAMMQAVAWNTLYDTRRRLVSTPVSRDWCRDWKGVLVFCWDTYLAGIMASCQSPELGRLNFEAVSAAIDELGHVPNYYMAHGAVSRDRSMPPLGSYAIWKTQCLAPDRAWLSRIYPKLCRWHEYWMRHRDGRGVGLLAWGSDPVAYEFPQLVPYNQTLQHCRQAAIYESGLDNSPLFDGVKFNDRSHTLELDDVALNSYYAMDCESLARLAEVLGKATDAARFWSEHEAMAARINRQLWDEENGIYCNRHWDGRFSRRWAPTSFFPLTAGVAPPDRARRMIEQHLLNPAEFWGQWVIPSIARSDPAYQDNDYWRGRIWGPLNFLVAEGLRRYRFDAVAAELAAKSLELFMLNWRRDGGVYENYNAQTGQGGDVWNAARLYHWGGLLVLVAVQELADLEPTGYLRFGSVHFPDAGLRSLRLGGRTFDVQLDDRLRVWEEGRPFLECTRRAIVRLPISPPLDRPIEVVCPQSAQLRLHVAPTRWRRLCLQDGTLVRPRRRRGRIIYAW